MLSQLLRALPPTATALVVGCSGPDITEELNTYETLLGEINDLRCLCPQDLGFDSMAECTDSLGYVGSEERECFEAALDGHHSAAQDYLACANMALQEYSQCLSSNVDCE